MFTMLKLDNQTLQVFVRTTRHTHHVKYARNNTFVVFMLLVLRRHILAEMESVESLLVLIFSMTALWLV